MATTYFEDSTAANVSVSGGAFTHSLSEAQPGSTGSDSTTASSGNGSSIGWYLTAPGDPASPTSTGTFTVNLNVTAWDAGVTLNARLHRMTSAGVQASVVLGTTKSSPSLGLNVWTFTNPALGTWAAGNRFAVSIVVTNTNAHGGAKGATWETGGTSDTAIAPWSTVGTVTGAANLAAAATLTASGTHTAFGGASLAATGSLSASGTRKTFGGAGLTSSATLSASGIRKVLGGASFSATSSLSASGTVSTGAATVTGGASLSATSTLSASGIRKVLGASTLSSTGSLSATGSHMAISGAHFSSTGTLNANGFQISQGGAQLVSSALLSASGTSTSTSQGADPIIIQKTGTSGTAVMQKTKAGWTYVSQKSGNNTPIMQKAKTGWTQVSGH